VVAAERRLRCTCPCGLDIFTCRTTDFTCTYSPALHDEVMGLMRAGTDVEGIVAAFVDKYGERILLAPRARGLGVLGYALPGALIAGAASLLIWVSVRRSRRSQPVVTPVVPAQRPATEPARPSGTAAELARLDRALDEIEA
jgi:cytochrome c-type biogenesis protein CcmH